MASEDNQKWQLILQKQRIANVKRWLKNLEQSHDVETLINEEYENILRALEAALEIPHSNMLAYKLIQLLHPVVLDYADWNRWLIYLEKLLATTKTEEALKFASLLVQVGDVKTRMGLLDDAEEAYKESIVYFQEMQLVNKQAYAMGRLSIVYSFKGESSLAILLCENALDIARQNHDDFAVAHLNLNLSSIYFRARSWNLSLEAANTAYHVFKEMGKLKEATKALLNIVSSSSEMGNWAQVESLAESLINDLASSGDIVTLSQLKNILGVAAFNQEKYMAAELSWHEALTLHSQINEPAEIAGLYNNLGMVYTRMKEWQEAAHMLNKGITAYQELGDIYNWANALDNLADFYVAQMKKEAACAVLHEALAGLTAVQPTRHSKQLMTHIFERISHICDGAEPQ